MAISRRALVITAVAVLTLAAGCAVLNIPTTTRYAVDDRVTTYRIPLYVKAIDFVQRHYQYKMLVSRVCGSHDGAACIERLFDWTHRNIRPTPEGWPLLDDHVLNIVIRGHGRDWQRALVFTTLSSYAGVPAFIDRVRNPDIRADLVLSFVRLDNRWIPFDVEHHVSFRDRSGRLADVATLVRDADLVDAGTVGMLPGGFRYSDFISSKTLVPFEPPAWLHADLQQPWPRLQYEFRRLTTLN